VVLDEDGEDQCGRSFQKKKNIARAVEERYILKKKVMVKQSRYRPRVAQRVPGS
jgi:hypothetical protein